MPMLSDWQLVTVIFFNQEQLASWFAVIKLITVQVTKFNSTLWVYFFVI